jgi:hypothetical protein
VAHNTNLANPLILGPSYQGIVTIYVTYTVTDTSSPVYNESYTASFTIWVGSLTGPDTYYIWIARRDELTYACNFIDGLASGTVILILLNSINIHSDMSFNGNPNQSIIIVAAAPDIVLGREGGPGAAAYDRWVINTGTPRFYFGTWDLPDALVVALPVTTYPFTVNTRGGYDLAAQNASNSMFLFQNGAAAIPNSSGDPNVVNGTFNFNVYDAISRRGVNVLSRTTHLHN